jgi:hypothetical protein
VHVCTPCVCVCQLERSKFKDVAADELCPTSVLHVCRLDLD